MSSAVFMFLVSGLAIFGMMIVLWVSSLILKNSSIIDIFWGTGFVLVAGVNYLLSPLISPAKLLLTILVTIWGLRLALHVGVRNWGKPEDFRYAKWREENGARWWWISLFQVFLLQGFIMWIVSTPITSLVVADGIPPLAPLALLGGLVWACGFFFEAVGDWQLTRFIANPGNKGNLMTSGVWKYTRHPNYFGDAAQWWGFYLIALSAGGWWTIFSPIIMNYLLVNVSGVAMLEKTMVAKSGYEEYKKQTNAFMPWWPKK